MNAAFIQAGSIALFLLSCFTYGRYISRIAGLDDSIKTPV